MKILNGLITWEVLQRFAITFQRDRQKHFMKQLRRYGSYSLFYRWNQMHHLSHREEPILLCIHIISMILMQESRTISQYLKLSKAYGLSSMRLFIWEIKTVPSSSQASQLDLILQLVVRMKTEKLLKMNYHIYS